MSAELSSIISVVVAITGVIASAIGGIFAYHKFLMKNLENVRKEFYKEITKLKEDSDKRDDEIKESLKEIKENMDKRDAEFKESLKDIKENMDKRDVEFKESLKDIKTDLKEDLKYIREKVFTN